MNRKAHYLMIGLACLALLMTSCRRLPFAEPTSRPTITPTPRSTPLPPVPTAVPLGSESNPLQLKITTPQTARSQTSLDSAISDLQSALSDETGLTINVELVNNDAEGLAALCASPQGTVSVAWLGGVAYAAAYADSCGSAALQVQRGTRSSATTSDEARIIANPDSGVSSMAGLATHTFCRLGYTDVFSWLIPTLMMRASGIEVSSVLGKIHDYDDAAALIDAVESGDCDAAGIAGSQFDAIASASARSSLTTVDQSASIPYEVLVYPKEVPPDQQQQISDALVSIGNGSRAALLNPLLQQDQLIPATDDDFADLRSFIGDTGIDLAQAGN